MTKTIKQHISEIEEEFGKEPDDIHCKYAINRAWVNNFISSQFSTRLTEILESVVTKQSLSYLEALKEICIEDDLLDLPSYGSIPRANKISNAWKALKAIEEINANIDKLKE